MLTGKRFRLNKDSLVIRNSDEGRKAITIPAGQVVRVVSGPRLDDKRMVDITWDGQALVMFAEDIMQRGEEVLAQMT